MTADEKETLNALAGVIALTWGKMFGEAQVNGTPPPAEDDLRDVAERTCALNGYADCPGRATFITMLLAQSHTWLERARGRKLN